MTSQGGDPAVKMQASASVSATATVQHRFARQRIDDGLAPLIESAANYFEEYGLVFYLIGRLIENAKSQKTGIDTWNRIERIPIN